MSEPNDTTNTNSSNILAHDSSHVSQTGDDNNNNNFERLIN